MNQQTQQQGMVNLPLYSNELGRMSLGGDSNLLPSLSSSHLHSRIPQHHQHQHQHQQQSLDPGYWYSFEPSQLRELQGLGNTLGPENHLVPSPGPSTGIGSPAIGGGLSSSGSAHLEGNGNGIPFSSTSEADFIFGQLAMGYPMAFANELQTATVSQMLEMGVLSGGVGGTGGAGSGHVGGASEPGGQGMHRYGTNVGRGVGGEGMGGGNGTTSPGYLDNDTMNMQWPGPSTGFQ
jgi:hypothetical protein